MSAASVAGYESRVVDFGPVVSPLIEENVMWGLKKSPRGAWLRSGLGLCLGLVWLCQPTRVFAICGLQAAIFEQLRSVQDRDAALVWSQQISQRRGGLCCLCHVSDYGPRNRYGSAIDLLLTGNDREDSLRKREAGRRVSEIPANPTFPDSPTFGDLIQQGILPASDLTPDLLASRNLFAKPSLEITVQQAKELVQQVQGESRFGILQLSGTYEISPEVAEAIAQFRGEMLILGLKSLSLEVAQALAESQAATVWLHSITSVTPEAAEAIARVPGYLVLSGLVELDSVPLAEKLAGRPGALSFPYLKSLTPETATALGRNCDALNLGGMTDASREVQDRLAETAGPLTMPSLTSLDSLPLTRKLAAGFAQSVLLPAIKTLSVEQSREIASTKRNLFFGGTLLPLTVMTEEVATVFANHPEAGRLELMGSEISEASLRILAESQLSIGLLELDSLSIEQIEILAAAPDSVPGGPFGTRAKFHLPNLKRLDSALLATTLLRCSPEFGGVTTISPAAAAALASVPNRELKYPDGTVRVLPPYSLSFPSLEELPPETARLLMTRPWSAIALPALKDVSLETVRSLARQTSHLTLGLTTLPPEFASAFGEMASNEFDLGGEA